jgi:hypothetical protein
MVSRPTSGRPMRAAEVPNPVMYTAGNPASSTSRADSGSNGPRCHDDLAGLQHCPQAGGPAGPPGEPGRHRASWLKARCAHTITDRTLTLVATAQLAGHGTHRMLRWHRLPGGPG